MSAVPARADWPPPPPQSKAGATLTELVIATFQLNQRFLEAAKDLASHGEITAAWWQVLGGVLDQPRSVVDIGRRMGLARQSVQRIADLLVGHHLAEYRPNPAHRRAKLLAPTEEGIWAVRRITLAQHPWADSIGAQIDSDDLQTALHVMRQLTALLDIPRP